MWRELLPRYSGRITGLLFGVFFGFIYLFAGFWDMLVFMLLIGIGYWFGSNKDEGLSPFHRFGSWLARVIERGKWLK